eukprot:353033-Chlamydomonas_euryale.AAC.9
MQHAPVPAAAAAGPAQALSVLAVQSEGPGAPAGACGAAQASVMSWLSDAGLLPGHLLQPDRDSTAGSASPAADSGPDRLQLGLGQTNDLCCGSQSRIQEQPAQQQIQVDVNGHVSSEAAHSHGIVHDETFFVSEATPVPVTTGRHAAGVSTSSHRANSTGCEPCVSAGKLAGENATIPVEDPNVVAGETPCFNSDQEGRRIRLSAREENAWFKLRRKLAPQLAEMGT